MGKILVLVVQARVSGPSATVAAAEAVTGAVAAERRPPAAVAVVAAIAESGAVAMAIPQPTVAVSAPAVAGAKPIPVHSGPVTARAAEAVTHEVTTAERVDGRPSLLATIHPPLQTVVAGAVKVPPGSPRGDGVRCGDTCLAVVV